MADIPGVPRKNVQEPLGRTIDPGVVLQQGTLEGSIAYLESIKAQYPQYIGFTFRREGGGFDPYGYSRPDCIALYGVRLENDEEYRRRTKKRRAAYQQMLTERLSNKKHYEDLIKQIDLALQKLSS